MLVVSGVQEHDAAQDRPAAVPKLDRAGRAARMVKKCNRSSRRTVIEAIPHAQPVAQRSGLSH
jgi:hypothetical protein